MLTLPEIIQIVLLLVGLGAIYGGIKYKLNQFEKDIEMIKTQLGNHIQHISDDIRQICERLARMEGKFNGRQL